MMQRFWPEGVPVDFKDMPALPPQPTEIAPASGATRVTTDKDSDANVLVEDAALLSSDEDWDAEDEED